MYNFKRKREQFHLKSVKEIATLEEKTYCVQNAARNLFNSICWIISYSIKTKKSNHSNQSKIMYSYHIKRKIGPTNNKKRLFVSLRMTELY